jgi:cell division protein FtsA
MARNLITGIDAGSSTIRVIIAEQKRDGVINILGVGHRESEGIRRGFVVNIDDAARTIEGAVRMAEKSSGLNIKRGIVAVGGIGLGSVKSKGIVMVSRADGEVTDYDIKRAIDQSESNLPNMASRKIIHSIPLHFKLDNNLLVGQPSGMNGAKLEVETFFITCLNQHLTDLIKTVESIGIAVEDIIASPLATSAATLTKQQKEVGCILVDIGASTLSAIVFEEGRTISLEVFPIGSSYITNDIALGFQVPLEEAEQMKINYESVSANNRKKLADIVEARLNDIFDLIETHLKKINRQEMLPGGIVLAGGGSNIFALDEMAKKVLRLPSKIGTFTLKNVAVSSSNLKEQIFNDPSWSTAIGLCLINSLRGSSEMMGNEGTRKKFGLGIKNWLRSLLP